VRHSVALTLAASVAVFSFCLVNPAYGQGRLGYYRSPAIHGDTVVFTSEGNLWRVGVAGGLAQRLTTHPLTQTEAKISPDGQSIAFTASYEGPREVYVMPIDGGLPRRCTYGDQAHAVGWTNDGKIVFASYQHNLLPDYQLFTLDLKTGVQTVIPLAQADDAAYSTDGKQLFFTRFSFQGSYTKRYKGGTAQSIWRWDGGDTEAKPLTADYPGTSRAPMCWKGRIYFETDRDGVMNIWSMDENGGHLKQHTFHKDFDVISPSLDEGRIVYQNGADLRLLDLKTGADNVIPIRLASDFDQMRERWVHDPMQWTTAAGISPDGSHVVLTARGQVFVAPAKPGRLIEVTRNKGVRYRDAHFLPDSKSIVALSDESGEVELWKLPATGDGSGAPEQLTHDSTILRWAPSPSPDGKWIAHTDKAHRLFLYDVQKKTNKLIASSDVDDIFELSWSSDSANLAYVIAAKNTFLKIQIYHVADGVIADATTDRFNSTSPAFSADGKFLYFISDRHLSTSVDNPWGPRAPEPFFDKQQLIFYVALQPGLKSPFEPADEITAAAKPASKDDSKAPKGLPAIQTAGLAQRIGAVPAPPGNYDGLTVCGNSLYYRSWPADGPASLVALPIRDHDVHPSTVLGGVSSYDATPDGSKIEAISGGRVLVFDANGSPVNEDESRVDLNAWTFSFDPQEEWRQMFDDAWRLHRDYLYAPNMHGVDWPAMRARYRPLVDRVSDRDELSDLLAQMVGEVSILHTFVYGGDRRGGTDYVDVASLGAEWSRDPALGGYRITKIYRNDPDDPREVGPLLKPGVDMAEGDVISMIDGVPLLDLPNAQALLRDKSGQQIRLRVFPHGDKTKVRDVVIAPVSSGEGFNLRYDDWEYSRREQVETLGKGNIGYVHLRAMGAADIDRWARDFYPVFDRAGLIVDVRHNDGGDIDSWILEKLLRRAWMYWNQRVGAPSWNMQYAFRGKIVVLCDAWTASDGEAFSEGFKRLSLGKVIGMRTWGGEVWLDESNTLVDNGVATAAEYGVYGPEGKWIVEGHGVEPDIVVDNLPHETFKGKDTQLEKAVSVLLDEIAKNPNQVPPVPPFPDKALHKR
jgi:tricorn protease